MTRVLILGAAAVQADAVASAKQRGYEVHVLAALPGPATPLADANADFSFTEREKLADYVRDSTIDLVYSVGSDIAMPVVGWAGEKLSLPYFVSEETALICNNKTRMRQTLADAGFSGNPMFVRVAPGDPAPSVDGPVMVKPADSQGQRGINRVNDGNLDAAIEAAQQASRTGTAIVEGFLDGPELSVNTYLVDGKPVFTAVSDRHVWPQFVGLVSGHTMPPTTVSGDAATELARMVHEAATLLGIENGPVYAQTKYTADGAKLVEISPRLDGCHLWRLVESAYGVDLIDTIWSHLLDGNPPATLDTPAIGTFDIDFICAPPGSLAAFDRDDVIRYYEPGDTVRPINGRYEKIGYLLGPHQS